MGADNLFNIEEIQDRECKISYINDKGTLAQDKEMSEMFEIESG